MLQPGSAERLQHRLRPWVSPPRRNLTSPVAGTWPHRRCRRGAHCASGMARRAPRSPRPGRRGAGGLTLRQGQEEGTRSERALPAFAPRWEQEKPAAPAGVPCCRGSRTVRGDMGGRSLHLASLCLFSGAGKMSLSGLGRADTVMHECVCTSVWIDLSMYI